MTPHVNEWRSLRDAHQKRAASALARRFSTMSTEGWQRYCEALAACPVAMMDGLAVLKDMLHDLGDWAAVDRFEFYAVKVWEVECDECARQCTTWGKAQDGRQKVA